MKRKLAVEIWKSQSA